MPSAPQEHREDVSAPLSKGGVPSILKRRWLPERIRATLDELVRSGGRVFPLYVYIYTLVCCPVSSILAVLTLVRLFRGTFMFTFKAVPMSVVVADSLVWAIGHFPCLGSLGRCALPSLPWVCYCP